MVNNIYFILSFVKILFLFDGMWYWCGLIWVIMNVLIGIGLRDMGYEDEVEMLCIWICVLIVEYGFVEYFYLEIGIFVGGGIFFWIVVVWFVWVLFLVGDK